VPPAASPSVPASAIGVQTPARQVPWAQAVPSALAAAAGHVPVLGLQVAIVWHSSGVGQGSGFPPVQTPDMHMSVCVQPLVSSQATPSVLAGFEHWPFDGLQVPAVWHISVAGQVTALPAQAPPLQVSPVVQALPSSQVAALLTCAQVPAPLHRSLVQTLLSLVQAVVAAAKQFAAASLHELAHSAPPAQGSPAWPQAPPLQVSTPLQKRPSSQGAVLFVCWQVPVPLQVSSVQALLSLVQALAAALKQFFAVSLHELLQATPPAQGSPA
jgi:hypothetical protein